MTVRPHVELEAGGGALVGADVAGDDERGLEREVLEGLEDLLGDGGFGDDALDGAGAVAEDGEEELAGGAQVVEPAAEGDGLANVLTKVSDGDDGSGYCDVGHGVKFTGLRTHNGNRAGGLGCPVVPQV